MKKFFAVLILAPFLAYSATAVAGGWILPVSRMACSAAPDLDFSQDGSEVPVAICVISSNAPTFEASFRFDAENGFGDFGDLRQRFTALSWHGVGGLLGRGVTAPAGEDILPALEGNAFVWAPEQSSATLDYVVEFRASWKAEKAPELSRLRITTDLASAL